MTEKVFCEGGPSDGAEREVERGVNQLKPEMHTEQNLVTRRDQTSFEPAETVPATFGTYRRTTRKTDKGLAIFEWTT